MQARFEHACRAGHDLHPHWKLGDSYGGFTAALGQESDKLRPAIVRRFQRQMQDMAGDSWTVRGWTAFAADGTRLEAPHTQANEAGLGCAGKEKTAPQVFLTTLRHLGLGLPWDFRNGPGTDSERHHLRDMLPGLPPQSLLVADAGFVGYALCREILAQGHDFLFRVGGNITLLTGLGWHFEEREGLVDLWPLEFRDQPPLTLRLIRLPQGGQTVCLLTSVLDEQQLSDADAAALYALRWGIEVGYRSYKQTLDRRTLKSRTPATCLLESAWIMIGLWLLGLMSVRRQLEVGRPARGWSTARVRDAVRRALRSVGQRPTGLDRALRDAVHDSYHRQRSKTARNYPRKKKEKPPSPPKIKPANAKEVQLAARLREQELLIL
jgi:hypothetical protein